MHCNDGQICWITTITVTCFSTTKSFDSELPYQLTKNKKKKNLNFRKRAIPLLKIFDSNWQALSVPITFRTSPRDAICFMASLIASPTSSVLATDPPAPLVFVLDVDLSLVEEYPGSTTFLRHCHTVVISSSNLIFWRIWQRKCTLFK